MVILWRRTNSSVSTTAIYTRMTREQQSRTISRVVNW